MKWTKASEPLPTNKTSMELHWRDAQTKKPIYSTHHIVNGCLIIISAGVNRKIELSDLEYLDESPSPTDESALKDEAEKLYPYPKYKFDEDWEVNEIPDLLRAAYLAGRRKTIEQLKAKDEEIEKLKKEMSELFKMIANPD
jgi:hypothetical protein